MNSSYTGKISSGMLPSDEDQQDNAQEVRSERSQHTFPQSNYSRIVNLNTVEDGKEVQHPPEVMIATQPDDDHHAQTQHNNEENTGIDIDQVEEEIDENFDAYGTMRPFKQNDDDVIQQQQISSLASGPVEDDGKTYGEGLARAKKLRQGFKQQSLKNRERGHLEFGESRIKQGGEVIIEEIKQSQGRPSLNTTEGNIEAPQQYENEQSEEGKQNRSNALHHPIRHFKSLSYYDKLKFGFKLFGCGISFISLILDFMYVSKAVFMEVQHYKAYQVFMILRITLILIYSVLRFIQQTFCFPIDITKVKGTDTLQMTAEESAELERTIKVNGMMFYVAQPAMLWFGLYRIYPVKDFMNLLIINFVGELLLQALPISLLTLQANTLSQNDNDDGTLSSLQKGTLGLNVLCLIEIIGQFIVLMKENCQLEEMKNSTRAGEIQFEPLSEESRRIEYHKVNREYGLWSSIIFSISLILGAMSLQDRICPTAFGLNNSVCVPCLDEQCLNCNVDYSYCDSCDIKFFNDSEGTCQKCDALGLCDQCTPDGKCQLCTQGYRLDIEKNKCIACLDYQGCKTCDETTCTSCKQGYTVNPLTKNCDKCDSSMRHCMQCSNSSSCEACQPNVSYLENGYCKCRTDNFWEEPDNLSQSCKCNGYISPNDNQCFSCNYWIPGCSTCSVTEDETNAKLKILTSTNTLNQSASFLQCDFCEPGKYYNNKKVMCEECSEKFTGCDFCDQLGQTCTDCKSDHLLMNDSVTKLVCIKCDTLMMNCARCSKKDSCDECSLGFKLNSEGLCEYAD